MCCLYWLMNKRTVLALIGQNIERLCKLNKNAGRRKAESESYHGATRVRHVECFPVSHWHVAIHRLIEMG